MINFFSPTESCNHQNQGLPLLLSIPPSNISNNYSVSFNETLQIAVPHELTINSQQLLVWTFNGYIVDNPRIHTEVNGGLTLSEAEPSDAGYYAVISTSNNNLQCQNAHFQVFVTCE